MFLERRDTARGIIGMLPVDVDVDTADSGDAVETASEQPKGVRSTEVGV